MTHGSSENRKKWVCASPMTWESMIDISFKLTIYSGKQMKGENCLPDRVYQTLGKDTCKMGNHKL